MTLRPYQREVLTAIAGGFDSFNRQLAVLPTGAGKTILFAHEAQRRAGLGERTLVLAHREELIEQAVAKIKTATGIVAEVEKAERFASLDAPVIVASIQSLHPERITRWPRNHFGLVVCDEAHHAISTSWQGVLQYFDAQALGVTATPDRGDMRNLGDYFENLAAEVSLLDLIKDGYLARISVQSVPLTIDLSKVKVTAGDLDESELAAALEPWLREIAIAIRDHALFRRTLVFVPLIATSKKFTDICVECGLNAEHVDGTSENRADILRRFAAGQIDLLSNAMLLTEGFDDPGIDCVVILRPTRSRPLFAQMVGRGTRTAQFKSELLLLDFLWMHERHRLIHPAHLVAKDEIEADTMLAVTAAKGGGDLLEVATEAQSQRESALRKRLEENKGRKAGQLTVEDWCLAHGRLDLAEYEPVMGWERAEVTAEQSKALKRAGVNVATVRGKGHASKLIAVHKSKQALILASDKERHRARKILGYEPDKNYTRQEFRRLMGSLRKERAWT